MKFLQTKFEDYIKESNINNLHTELEDVFSKKNNLKNSLNMIFYGPSGTGKYTQALKYIEMYSKTNLKYERKINVSFQKKRDISLKISDIHFEIDMELLGCNAKLLWNQIYKNILDILSARPNNTGIILCKNFHKIHSELLDIFYSYMQMLYHKKIHIHYVFLTEQISFLPDNIINKCQIIPVKRLTKRVYKKCTHKTIDKNTKLHQIKNIKDIYINNQRLNNPNKKITDEIINNIENYKNIKYLQFRDCLYNIFIYHIDINECILDIIRHFIQKNKITDKNITEIFFQLNSFLKLYNNNYRPIYHLEKFLFKLCSIIHEL
jgi:hypothetical protein